MIDENAIKLLIGRWGAFASDLAEEEAHSPAVTAKRLYREGQDLIDGKPEAAKLSEMHDAITHLPFMVQSARLQKNYSMRLAAKEIGIAASTLHRFENGLDISMKSLLAIMRWVSDGNY